MRMLDAFISSSITTISIPRRSSLGSSGQSQEDADGKLGEHFVKAGRRTVDCLIAWYVFGGFQIKLMFVAVYLFLAGSRYACKCACALKSREG